MIFDLNLTPVREWEKRPHLVAEDIKNCDSVHNTPYESGSMIMFTYSKGKCLWWCLNLCSSEIDSFISVFPHYDEAHR